MYVRRNRSSLRSSPLSAASLSIGLSARNRSRGSSNTVGMYRHSGDHWSQPWKGGQKKRHAQSQTRLDSKQTSQRRPAQDRPRSRQPAKVPRPRHPRPRNPPHAHTKAASYHHQTPTPSMQPTLKCATEMCVLSRPARGPVTLLVFPPQFPRCTSSTPHSFPILFFN